MYKLTIKIPDNIDVGFKFQPLNIIFDSAEQKEEYLRQEYAATAKEIRALADAATYEARVNAHYDLLVARRTFFILTYKRLMEQ